MILAKRPNMVYWQNYGTKGNLRTGMYTAQCHLFKSWIQREVDQLAYLGTNHIGTVCSQNDNSIGTMSFMDVAKGDMFSLATALSGQLHKPAGSRCKGYNARHAEVGEIGGAGQNRTGKEVGMLVVALPESYPNFDSWTGSMQTCTRYRIGKALGPSTRATQDYRVAPHRFIPGQANRGFFILQRPKLPSRIQQAQHRCHSRS